MFVNYLQKPSPIVISFIYVWKVFHGVEGIWRGSTFVPVWLGTAPLNFAGLDKVILAPKAALSLSSAKIVLRAEVPPPTRCAPVDAEQYDSRPEGRQIFLVEGSNSHQ